MRNDMTDQDLSSVEGLAAEYVLGNLSGINLQRFKKLMEENPDVQRMVVEWQEMLIPLNEQTQAVEPPPHVLTKLMQEISNTAQSEQRSWWQNLNLWRPLAFGNGLLSVLLAGYIAFQVLQPPVETRITSELQTTDSQLLYVGVLEDAQQKPKVAVLAYNNPWRLEIKSKDSLVSKPGTELRLWMIDRKSNETKYLATLTPGATQIKLTETIWDSLKTAKQLLISADPVDSSIIRPSDQILIKGVCINLKNWSAGS
jgi:anti-sigma-K factor RskA